MSLEVSVILVSVLLAAVPSSLANLDFFSSTLKTKGLLEKHSQLVSALRQYSAALSDASAILNRYLSESEVAKVSDPWPNEGDPLRTYVLIRRTTSDLDKIITAIRKHRSLDPILEIENLREKASLPTSADMSGITTSLVRLQKTYLLKPLDIIQGKVSETLHLPVALSASDCLNLGQKAEELSELYTVPVHAKLWYEAGLLSYQNESAQGNTENQEVTVKIQERLADIKNKTQNLLKFPAEFNDFLHQDVLSEPLPTSSTWDFVNIIYRRLCRGDNLRAPSMDMSNTCHLRQGPQPYMKIRPLKVEVKSSDPYLVVLHDIIGNGDIESMKKAAAERAARSSHILGNASSGVTDIRVSTTSWLPDDVVPSLVKRIALFLGMHTNSINVDVEEFQVLNYGVGGHYSLHRDYFENEMADRLHNKSGERIATLMLYLSDVEEGGWTAFPYAGLALKPIKGAAAFWWNLRSDGSGDYRTTHGACPVIYGTKWVSNKWFRMRPQMFKVPCKLEGSDIVRAL